MRRKGKMRRCAHPGCGARVGKDRELCRVHGSLGTEEPRLRAPAEGLRVPTLEEELARLAAQRDQAEEMLQRCLAEAGWDWQEVLRSLAVTWRAGERLVGLLLRRGAQDGVSEREEFLATVAELVWEEAEEREA